VPRERALSIVQHRTGSQTQTASRGEPDSLSVTTPNEADKTRWLSMNGWQVKTGLFLSQWVIPCAALTVCDPFFYFFSLKNHHPS
jgi:hypothetical protein